MAEPYFSKENCCGCTACVNVCPRGAIRMTEDLRGFPYPFVSERLCTGCGRCRRACPAGREIHVPGRLPQPKVFALKHKSVETRLQSSSGAAFTAFSDAILREGGVVYGALLDENFKVCHARAETPRERDRFRGSKYAQSRLENTFNELKNDLTAGRKVLFTGVPCQCAGLYAALAGEKFAGDLIVCDIVCHGVGSPRILADYLTSLQNTLHSKILELKFRCKPMGWRKSVTTVRMQNGKLTALPDDTFSRLFQQNMILRDSCHHCQYTRLRRSSDITIGDFWGIENCLPEFEDDKGVSLVLLNTKKGRALFESVLNTVTVRPCKTESCRQPSLTRPCAPPPDREAFWNEYRRAGFDRAVRKYVRSGLLRRLKTQLKRVACQARL